MKKLSTIFLMLTVVFALTSCVLVVDDYKKVSIENRDSNREAYISKVEYRSSSCYSDWTECWHYTYANTDSNINFNLTSGNYKLRVTVARPGYYGQYYSTTYETSDYTWVDDWCSTTYVFDGSSLWKKY